MKNRIIKGICLRKMRVTGRRRLQCKTDFKFLKWQALQHNHPLWYQRTEQPKVDFVVPLWKCS